MPKYDSQKIADSIKKAVKAAQAFATIDDGGSCNFDCAYIRVPRMRESQALDIKDLAGVHVSIHGYRLHGRILKITGGLSGQGARNTKMAEAIRDSLKADGFDAAVYYQTD